MSLAKNKISASKKIQASPNLYLLGFMGTGKSVLGRKIAARLDYKFLDSDSEIEKKYGMKITEIFEKLGEEKFREMEKEFIESGHPANKCVIACGGGMVCRSGMPELLKEKGVCVVLFSKPDEIFERVSKNKKRPLMNVENPLERIKTLLRERTPFYMKSGVAIATNKDLKISEEHILRVYAANKKYYKDK